MAPSKHYSHEGRIRISVTCLAEFATTYGRSAESVLRPFKFNKRGEGFARSSYYQHALTAIRMYHSNANDLRVLETALFELRARADKTTSSRERSKLRHNISAIEAYRRIYRGRNFNILPNRRIAYRIGQIDVTAQPDLWVEENGTQVLLKIGVSKKTPSYVDIVLTVMRKAAVSNHHTVRAKNVVYLDVSTGRELICKAGLARFNQTFMARAREIANVWPKMKTPPASPDQGGPRPSTR
jgi:hypothetical protein